jgi:hypothetical protein
VKHLSILIKKIKQSLKKNPRSVPLLDMVLMILVIAYGIMKITKSLGVDSLVNNLDLGLGSVSCGKKSIVE